MKFRLIRELTLYRFRYYIGYGLFALLLVTILGLGVTTVPHGLTDAEMASAVASNQINLTNPRATDVVNLPYHLLQKASISLLGLTPFSIKLPSLLLAFSVGIGLAYMLRHWFGRNVAVLSTLLAGTSVPFMIMGRTGAPIIMVTVWTTLLLIAATQLTTKTKGTFPWKMVALVSAILPLYAPLGIYPVIALLVSGLLHPHVRHQLKRTSKLQVASMVLAALVLLSPLVIAAVAEPSVLLATTGIENFSIVPAALLSSLGSLATTFFSFAQTHIGVSIAPFLSFPVAALAILGIIRVVMDHHAARSYMLLFWTSIVGVVIVLDPSQTLLLFVPITLFLAIGVETLVREWYSLFPRNPYARIGALVPLAIIVVGTMSVETSRYFDGYRHATGITGFHAELDSVREALGNDNNSTKRIVVPADQVGFYDILRREYSKLSIETTVVTDASVRQIVTADSGQRPAAIPTMMFTGPLQEDGILVRVYGPRVVSL